MRLEAIVRLRPGGAVMLAAFAVLAAWQPVIAQNSRRLQLFTREQSLVLAESESEPPRVYRRAPDWSAATSA